MLILGIDPGTAIMGYGLVAQQGNHLKHVCYGVIRTEPTMSTAARLLKLHSELEVLIREYQPDVVAVEELFFNKNTRTALAVGQARGVILLAAASAGKEIFEYTPLQVKQGVVGYGRAEKHQIQEMVKMLLCLKELPKPDDAADALAIAICHAHSRKIKALKKEI
ncbi:MAG TPA: crossover junction endodeoxyribonuclease RuvC [Bacillota bacterium]|nr:crossover junction endodeoxyribonuclease RuvC [Bacillota bacterium]